MLRNKLVIAGIFCASLTASEMELVLDVGKDNTNLSAQSQAKSIQLRATQIRLLMNIRLSQSRLKV